MQEQFTQAEKREEERIKINIILECISGQTDTEYKRHYIAYTKDISICGARLILPDDIRAGDLVEINFDIPEYFIAPIASGEIVWTRKVQSDERKNSMTNEAGIKFLNMSILDKGKIELFIKARDMKNKESCCIF